MVIAAGIGAVGAVAGGAIAAGGAKSAGKAAAAAADRASEVQQQTYQENKQTLAPYVQAGLPATTNINALLGLDDGSANYEQYLPQRTGMGAPGITMGGMFGGMDLGQFGQPSYTPEEIAAAKAQAVTANRQRANDAFNAYRTSTGYDFRMNEGMRALNSGYAGAGTIKSGAAIRAANDYGQGMASQEFGNYLNAIGTQQGVGLNAAGAQAGVATNYANSLGNIYQQNGANQANAALASASAMGGAINGAASSITSAMGYNKLFGGR